MALLGIDLGTTHIKAGVFAEDGSQLAIARRQTPVARHTQGCLAYDPEEFWLATISAVCKAVASGSEEIQSVGIASMAESGLFVDPASGKSLTPILPWFDTTPAGQALRLEGIIGRREGFFHTGIYPSFKISLAKILWLQDSGFQPVVGKTIWLSAADYVLFRLTGVPATDASLAGRTYAFHIGSREWDEELLGRVGLKAGIFPPELPSGKPAGSLTHTICEGLPQGTPAAVCGHDHICASFVGGLNDPQGVFDSIGTAETLTGLLPQAVLGEREYQSGLSFGCHVLPDRLYWLGGLSTSGGSVDWLRRLLGNPPPDFADLDSLLGANTNPGSILFLPYLAGSGSPHTAPELRGAFLGLDSSHTTANLYQAVLEGISCEVEFIRRAGEKMTGQKIRRIVAAGGGTSSLAWMRIKASLSGCSIELFPVIEATLLGAALLAGEGAGIYSDHQNALEQLRLPQMENITSTAGQTYAYQQLYQKYLAVQEPYRKLVDTKVQ